MKKLMQSVAMSATMAAILAAAVMDAARPTGARAQQTSRCKGDSEPVCSVIKVCHGIFWWKKCGERSFYWDLAPPPAPVD